MAFHLHHTMWVFLASNACMSLTALTYLTHGFSLRLRWRGLAFQTRFTCWRPSFASGLPRQTSLCSHGLLLSRGPPVPAPKCASLVSLSSPGRTIASHHSITSFSAGLTPAFPERTASWRPEGPSLERVSAPYLQRVLPQPGFPPALARSKSPHTLVSFALNVLVHAGSM